VTTSRAFRYIDGREVMADSPVAFFERLMEGEYRPPESLDRYLDLIRSRAARGFGIQIDAGEPGQELGERCRRALASLLDQGWVRVLPRPQVRIAYASGGAPQGTTEETTTEDTTKDTARP
jgi:hypothetical protein